MSDNFKSVFTPNHELPDRLLIETCKRLGFDDRSILDQLKREHIQKITIRHVFSLVNNPRENSILAGAITMWQHYRNCPLTVREYFNVFKPYFRDDVAKFFDEHAEKLQKYIQFENDFNISYFAAGTWIDQYLAKLNYDDDPLEIPQFALLRVAVGQFCCRNVTGEDTFENILRIYRRYSNAQITPASPIIFNMGFKEGSSPSCLIYAVDDSLDDILKILYEDGMGSKNNAGSGLDFSGLRHSNIGRHGVSQGIIPLLKVVDDLTKYINQGGRRPGAKTGSIRVHHYDTPEFITVVDKVGEDNKKVSKINTSLMLSDLFMKRCEEGGKWTLFCPKQTGNLNLLHGKEFEEKYLEYEQKAQVWKRYQKYQALNKLRKFNAFDPKNETLFLELEKEFGGSNVPPERIDSREFDADSIMDEICDMQCKVGMPYIVHGCNTNRKNNMDNVGPVRSSNLCQEIMIPAVPKEQTGCCFLSSIVLSQFADRDKGFNFIEFGKCERDLVICLNQVIDVTTNASDKAVRSNRENRPIGGGVNGFGDMCNILNIPPVDMNKLPKFDGYDENGDPKYRYVDITKEAPDYTPEALKERVLNPELADLNWKIWSCKYYNALWQSKEEAKKFGPYPNFWTSKLAQGKLQYHLWQEEERETGRKYPFKLYPAEPSEWGQEGSWEELIKEIMTYGVRNALLESCQPTATSAQIRDVAESTEFHMQNLYTRKVITGDYPIENWCMVEDFKEAGLWSEKVYNNIVAHDGSVLHIPEDGYTKEQVIKLRFLKEKYLTMWEIPKRIIIDLSAQRQICIDHSQSLNLYIEHPTPEELKAIHMYTWIMGLKTGMYYLRTRSENEALRIGSVAKNKEIAEVESQIKNLVFGYKASNNGTKTSSSKLVEHYDEDMLKALEIIMKAQEDFQLKEKEEQNKLISETLITASRPEPTQCCMIEGKCFGCDG